MRIRNVMLLHISWLKIVSKEFSEMGRIKVLTLIMSQLERVRAIRKSFQLLFQVSDLELM